MKINRLSMNHIFISFVCISFFVGMLKQPAYILDIFFNILLIGIFFRIIYVIYKTRQFDYAINIDEIQSLDFNKLKADIIQSYKGHSYIVDDVFEHLERNILLGRESKPLASYFFIGPTGTGKTYLSTHLSKAFFSDKDPLYFDLTQYKSIEHIQIFIQELAQSIQNDPRQLILLDEIDKCSSELHDCLYRILDQGILQLDIGEDPIQFNQAIIIATANNGFFQTSNREILNMTRSERLLKVCENSFYKKSFLARWDNFYFFPLLEKEALCEVALLEFSNYWSAFDININYIDADIIIKAIIENENYKEFGVREFKRVIHDLLQKTALNAKSRGFSTINLSYVDGKIKATFTDLNESLKFA